MSRRADFEVILKAYGHNILLQRAYIGDGSAATPSTTYRRQLERHTVRYNVGRSRTLTRDEEELIAGIITNSERVYYFKWDAIPCEMDRIYEQDPSSPRGFYTFTINQVVPMRGLGGQIIYWVAGVKRERPN
jgi:hypothetical protein